MGFYLFSKITSSYFKSINSISVANYCVKMSKTAILLLAEGAEEMEAVITADVLRRAGVQVTIASINDEKCVKCSRDVKICTDSNFTDATKDKNYDVVVLPGGVGYKKLAASQCVGTLLKDQESKKGIIAAICAAPVVLKAHGIAKGSKITSYPSTESDLKDDYKYIEDQKVVTDGNIITSRGPATAFDFGLAIVEKLLDKESALTVAKAMLYTDYK
ncbi:protein dj-1beta-like [Leptopilina heterotoma]|uniref:protein dj-1beta-like n=1 Tax=Leptopilina heterotoma TaxID=63436 RepID=UPI001CA8A7AF|nr:protein dj-1beta-like [Leptopilina heterotoma]